MRAVLPLDQVPSVRNSMFNLSFASFPLHSIHSAVIQCPLSGTWPGCGNAPFQNRTDDELRLFPPEAGWFGVKYKTKPNLALVLKDGPSAADLSRSLTLSKPGLPCRLSPVTAVWPDCAL